MKKKWIEISINILFWLFSSWIIVSSFSILNHSVDVVNGQIVSKIERSKEIMYFFIVGQPFFALYFYLQYSFIQKLNNKSGILFLILKLGAIAILFLVLFHGVVLLFFIKYIDLIWFPSLWYGIFILYTAIAIGYGFMKTWIRMEKNKNQLEISNKQAELNVLRSQLHPHFLFNTMNNLLSMVDQVNNPKLAKSIDKLSGLLRYVVYDNKSDHVHVSKEIQFIQDFSELHLLRFEDDEIDFKLNIIGNNESQLIEMGILLSFVENAFKHGVQPEFTSFIHIDIDISSPSTFIFKLKNSIPPKINLDSIGGYGLKSTKERLQLAYPNRHKLHINEAQNIYNIELIISTDEGNNS